MKKITILALHLGFGGVENAIISLSNMLCNKYDVEIISTYKIQEIPAFEVNPKVKISYLMTDLKPNPIELKKAIKSFNVLQIIKQATISAKVLYLKKKLMINAIKKLDSDIVISTRDIHNRWLGRYGKDEIIKIAQEHNHHNNNDKYINKILKSIKNIDYFMPVSEELTKFYSNKLKGTKTKCIYIPHSIDNYPKQTSILKQKNIISVGRLVQEKGYLDLIDVFKSVNKIKSDWKLNIVGDGVEKNLIEQKIQENGLRENVILHGFKAKDELEKIYLDSSIYVMASYTESFGLVLIEAESYGIPLIAFDSAQGANEIIKNDKNGYLISDRNFENMAKKIIELIENEELRISLGKNGRTDSEKYKKENVEKQWFELIDNLNKENIDEEKNIQVG